MHHILIACEAIEYGFVSFAFKYINVISNPFNATRYGYFCGTTCTNGNVHVYVFLNSNKEARGWGVGSAYRYKINTGDISRTTVTYLKACYHFFYLQVVSTGYSSTQEHYGV